MPDLLQPQFLRVASMIACLNALAASAADAQSGKTFGDSTSRTSASAIDSSANSAAYPADKRSVANRWYFHRPDISYGSAAYRGPIGTFADRGFSIIVFGNSEREFGRMQWRKGWESVTDALRNPNAAIERAGGWSKFLRTEFLPDNGSVWKWAWAPNYAGHVVAGGITNRYLTEWFEDHGTPRPAIVAGVVYLGMMVTNEVLEHPNGKPGSSGTVADLLMFEPLGMLIFRSDRVAGFFSQTLQAADWSPQASIQFPRASLRNNSQIMSYKVPLPLISRTRLMLQLGQGAATGVSVKLDDELSVAGAVGFETQTRTVDPVTQEESVKADYGGGLYIDRNNSLLASIVRSKRFMTRTAINVYPGVLPGTLNALGIWATETPRGEWSVGFGYRHVGGLGLGWGAVTAR